MKHTIVVPSEVHHSDGELLQADVAHPDGEVLNDSIVDKLAEMRASERPVTQRIGNVLTEFLKKRLLRFTLADWVTETGKSKTLSKNDILTAISLGLIARDTTTRLVNSIVYKFESQFIESVQWEEISKHNYQILDVIVRSFGTRHFSRLEIAQASGISPENMSYDLKMLKKFSIIDMKRDGSTNYIYSLAVPIEEAISQLQLRGFSPVALVG